MTKTSFAHGQLKAFVERVERLEEEKKAIAADIKEVKAEAKANDYDVSIINAVIKIRAMDADKRQEAEAMLDTYLAALGMLPQDDIETPVKSGGPTEGQYRPLGNRLSVTDQQQGASPLPVAVAEAALKTPATRGGVDALSSSPVQIHASQGDLVLPDFMRRSKPKPEYTPEQLLGAG